MLNFFKIIGWKNESLFSQSNVLNLAGFFNKDSWSFKIKIKNFSKMKVLKLLVWFVKYHRNWKYNCIQLCTYEISDMLHKYFNNHIW